MHVLITIALKSLLIAGLTLGLLQLMRKRSAAERSWVAHIGLLALVIMAVAPLVLPSWNVEAPSILGQTTPAETAALPTADAPMASSPVATTQAVQPGAVEPAPIVPSLSPLAAATALYAVPAAILLLITFLALARLITLRARADVLVDGHWLSALARAQRRMGFKHGTALLTSNELASPISWGLMRPVILLNSRAVEASDEAEAIIAHELAHVARMDWIKLLLARIATALFWFNPLVWLLAREAHQLREETADDTVLAADIVDTDYAQLLVGVARHECPGLLLGAHGVAPSKSSLARRVARVLDGKSVRGPVARSFGMGVFAGAVLVAAPLAALTLTPAAPKAAKPVAGYLAASEPAPVASPSVAEVPTDLPHLIASGVSTSVTTAVAAATAIAPEPVVAAKPENFRVEDPNGATVERVNGTIVSRAPSGATVTVYPPDAQGRRKMVARAPNGATAVTYASGKDAASYEARAERYRDRANVLSIDRIIEMKAVGVTPEFMATMRAASPRMRSADLDDIVGLRAVGVTPDYVRSLAMAGLPNLSADELTEAKAVGITGDYVRDMRAAGFRGDLDDYVELRAVGVTPAYAAQFKKVGYNITGARQLVKFKVHGITADTVRVTPPRPPQAPRPPEPDDDPDNG
jgi:beta-lactamase regulating signal transducer with metallopeptidase domain